MDFLGVRKTASSIHGPDSIVSIHKMQTYLAIWVRHNGQVVISVSFCVPTPKINKKVGWDLG